MFSLLGFLTFLAIVLFFVLYKCRNNPIVKGFIKTFVVPVLEKVLTFFKQ